MQVNVGTCNTFIPVAKKKSYKHNRLNNPQGERRKNWRICFLLKKINYMYSLIISGAEANPMVAVIGSPYGALLPLVP